MHVTYLNFYKSIVALHHTIAELSITLTNNIIQQNIIIIPNNYCPSQITIQLGKPRKRKHLPQSHSPVSSSSTPIQAISAFCLILTVTVLDSNRNLKLILAAGLDIQNVAKLELDSLYVYRTRPHEIETPMKV